MVSQEPWESAGAQVGWEPEATGYAWGLQELADAGVDWGLGL